MEPERIKLLEKCEVNKKIYQCFIDYGKALDLANHYKLMEKARQRKMDGKDQRLIQRGAAGIIQLWSD